MNMKINIVQSKSRWRCVAHANPVVTCSAAQPAAYRASRSPLRFLTALIASFMLLAAAACGDDGEESADEDADLPVIVATTGIWADVVSNLACDGLAKVENIIPSGSDPHVFEASFTDQELMENASLVVANGLGLEESLLSNIEAVEDTGVPVFELTDHIDLIDFAVDEDGHDDHDEEGHDEEGHDEEGHDEEGHDEEGHDEEGHDEEGHDEEGHDEEGHDEEGHDEEGHDEEGHDEEDEHHHDHSGSDPHVWFDPVRVSSALPELAEHLVADAGLDETAVNECLDAYQAELVALDSEIEQMLEQLPNASRKLVTNHDALGYYADRYGFSIIGSIIPGFSTMAETNPARLEELAETIEKTGVKAIFAENIQATGDAEALASEVGDVKVVSLFTGSLGPEGSGAETYIGFLRTNTERIVEGLS